jgi:pilus assembly protein CpaC
MTSNFKRSRRILRCLAGCLALATSISPAAEPTPSGLSPITAQVPSRLESTSLRHQKASSFIDRISRNDASISIVVGQGRTLTLGKDLQWPTGDASPPSVAVSDPLIADVVVIGSRQIRVLGRRIGITDLTVSSGTGEEYSYEIHVEMDLRLLEAKLTQLFPDAHIRLAHLGPNLIVEGEARDTQQLDQISRVLKKAISATITVDPRAAFLRNQQATGGTLNQGNPNAPPQPQLGPQDSVGNTTGDPNAAGTDQDQAVEQVSLPQPGRPYTAGAVEVEIINLMRIPGPQQVMLHVQIAELNRTAYRQIGADLLFEGSGNYVGTRITNVTNATSTASVAGLLGNIAAKSTDATTAFGIFEGAGFHAFITALRRNKVFTVLAEPNLVAMHGHRADFLAGGQFPVPVPQSGAGGGPATVTIEYKPYGVSLSFVPYVIDGEVIRMEVDPGVSSIDYTLGTEVGGVKVPGLNTRQSHTTVEMREGQTLAIAGLMLVSLEGTTDRIPGLGDLPYIGPFFSNTTGQRVEKELVVLVTPHLVQPISADQVGPLPGTDVYEPNDLEFYLLNRIEGHTGHAEYRSTLQGEDPWGCQRRLLLECEYVHGPHGFSQ